MKHKNLLPLIFFLCLMSISVSIQAQDYLVDTTFNPTFGGRTHQFWDYNNALAIQPDQKILAVFRNGAWYQILSSTGTFKADSWGLNGDIPIPAQGF